MYNSIHEAIAAGVHVKVRVEQPYIPEVFWVKITRYEDGHVYGQIKNNLQYEGAQELGLGFDEEIEIHTPAVAVIDAPYVWSQAELDRINILREKKRN